MPCTFDMSVRNSRPSWRSGDNQLRPSANQGFTVGTDNIGGGCGHCRATQNGVVWTSMNYVLCLRCATTYFGAPDLRTAAPELFITPEQEDDMYEDAPDKLETKRDKDFDPRKYKPYTYGAELTGKNGCSGYRCETYPAPHRTIPALAGFMLGEGNRGHLCLGCFAKLKAKWDMLPARAECACCGRRVAESRLRPVLHWREPSVCASCQAEYFVHCPETDNGWVDREHCVCAMTAPIEGVPQRRVYASNVYASRHWFCARDNWYMSEAEYDREMLSVDPNYRDRKLAEHSGRTIFSYGTNVIKMHGFPEATKKDDLCYGVELEMQPNRNHTHEKLVEVLGGKFVTGRPYILCADSSIGANGVELITLPYTLANHKSGKHMPWDKLLADLRKVGQSGHVQSPCGMHVHINRRALSNLQMGKMLVVINAPEMQELIATVAQRSEANYCKRYFKKVADGGKIIGNHGDALNMSNSKGTCELRIFRGNLRYERVMKNLEFTDALCNYAAEQSIQKVHVPEEMLAWINDNKGHYPHLVKFLKEEYSPTKAYQRTAARIRKTGKDWGEAVTYVNVEPTEGDI